MLVSSALNPSARSTVQLLVVHLNDERVLVPTELHAKYSDLQGFIVKEWGFESSEVFSIETDELDICAGKRVRIHEEAWFGIKDIVGNVYVRIRRSERDLLRSQRHNPLPPVKDEVKQEDLLTSRAASESADEAEVEQQTRAEIRKDELIEETPTVRRREQEPKQDKMKQPAESPGKQKLQGDMLNLFSDEAEAGEDEAQKDKEQRKNEPCPPKENGTAAPRPTWKTFLGSLHRNTPNGNSSANTNANRPTSASTLGTPAFNTPAPVSKMRSKTEPSAEGAATAASGGAAAGADSDRVLIVIEPPPDSIYEPRGFRIRREHSVRTVLKGACKAFKIDYTKTRLRMVTEVDENSQGDDGELVTVKCDDGDTMNSLSVRDNQRFIIEMVEEEEEEEAESEA